MNINNLIPRFVVANVSKDGLEKGKKYWINGIHIFSFNTEVYLEGLDEPVNSVYLDEVEDKLYRITSGRKITCIKKFQYLQDIELLICNKKIKITPDLVSNPSSRGIILLIGRDSECDVVVNDKYVSRHHCFLYNDGNCISLYDCSTNGTSVI